MATLGFERGTGTIAHQVELSRTVERLVAIAREIDAPDGVRKAIADDVIAGELANLRAEVAALQAMTAMTLSRNMREAVPGPEGNLVALHFGELTRRVHAFALSLLGPHGIERETLFGDWPLDYLESFKWGDRRRHLRDPPQHDRRAAARPAQGQGNRMIVDLLPTDDQAMIADSVAALLGDRLPLARFRDAAAWGAGAERALWGELAGLGLFGLGVAEAQGGVGFAVAEEVTVAQLLGRHLVSPSVLATMVAAHVAGDAAPFAAGTARAAFANPLAPVASLTGSARVQRIDADGVDLLLLVTDAGSALYPPTALIPGPTMEGIDETVSLDHATLDLGAAVARRTGAAVALRSGLLVAAYLSGIAAATRDMGVDYAKVREQFGQPIGAFQAIKHYCAEMARKTEAAFSQTCYVAALAGAGTPSAFGTACARLLAGDAALENARINIQIHGGMGFTDESDAHSFLKRAHVMTVLNGGRRIEQQRIMASAD